MTRFMRRLIHWLLRRPNWWTENDGSVCMIRFMPPLPDVIPPGECAVLAGDRFSVAGYYLDRHGWPKWRRCP
jgi:hypothetical protein